MNKFTFRILSFFLSVDSVGLPLSVSINLLVCFILVSRRMLFISIFFCSTDYQYFHGYFRGLLNCTTIAFFSLSLSVFSSGNAAKT